MMAALLVTLETPTGKALNINDMVGIFFHSFALPENSSAIYESLCNVINRYRLICYFKV